MGPKKFYFLELFNQKNNAENNEELELIDESPTTTFENQSVENKNYSDAELLEFVKNKLLQLINTTDRNIREQLINIGYTLIKLNKQEERISHRFDGQSYFSGNGIDYFSDINNIEETAEFADEVERLCEEGLDRRSAYSQAKYNLIYKRR